LDGDTGGTPDVQTVKALNSPDARARLAEYEFQTYGNSSKEFADTMKADFAKMATIIRDVSIVPQ
jgi:tripartite-type tricarboxylate transporter receptor subunit TctC